MHRLAMQHTDHLEHLIMIISRNIHRENQQEDTLRALQISAMYLHPKTSGRVGWDVFVYVDLTPIWFARCLGLAMTLTRTSETSDRNVWIVSLNEKKCDVLQSVRVAVFRNPDVSNGFVQMVI